MILFLNGKELSNSAVKRNMYNYTTISPALHYTFEQVKRW